MIFVTVGTHEQQFDRLVRKIDELRANGEINEEVLIQTGYSTYIPEHCAFKNFFTYSEMIEEVRRAHIVITHGGPSSFIMPLQLGKIPIVVPRMKQYNEHVNDHQVAFCEQVAKRMGNIILIEDVEKIPDTIRKYEEIVQNMKSGLESNNARFNRRLGEIVDDLVKKK